MKFKSQLVTAVSGSVGGLTGSRNRGGMYFRGRAMPSDPGTVQQQTVKDALTQLATAWNSVLTDAQREAWRIYAINVTVTDRLGDQRNLSGQQHYVRSNVPRLQAGLDRVDDAPITFDLGSFTASLDSASAGSDELTVSFDDGAAWVDESGSALLVYSSRPQNPGINFFKGPYQFAGMVEGDDTTPPTTPATLDSPFPLSETNLVYAQFRVSRADGRLSGLARDFVAIGS